MSLGYDDDLNQGVMLPYVDDRDKYKITKK